MRDVHLVPYGGLCNRMRVIASCIELCKDTKSHLIIHWNENSECKARWQDLFEPVDHIKIEPVLKDEMVYQWPCKKNFFWPAFKGTFFTKGKYYWELSSRWSGGFWKRSLYRLCGDRKRNSNFFEGDLTKIFLNSKKITIVTCQILKKDFNIRNIFIPIKYIQNKIDTSTLMFNSDTIGIHIRRTDHKTAIENSPLINFHNKIKKESQSTKFFLATDSQEVKDEFIRMYGKRILTNTLPLNRDSLEGMIGAVVDLWSLSRTKKIWGSYYSSYSEMAAILGNINLEII